MEKPGIVVISGVNNLEAVCLGFARKGYDVAVVNHDLPEIINATKGKNVFLVSLFFDNSLVETVRQIDCPVVVWLPDKVTVSNIVIDAESLSRFFVFSLDPVDVEDFRKAGFKSWLLPCNSWFDDLPLPQYTYLDRKEYGCDVSFVGQSITTKHNPYFQFLLNVSNLNRTLNSVIEKQTEEFTKNRLPELYEKEDLSQFSLQFLFNYMSLLNNRNLDFVLGCESSSRLRRRLVSALQGFDALVVGDDFWGQHCTGRIRYIPGGVLMEQTPKVFRFSKINLNISKTFFSGTIQRVFDIIYCGGFCLTDYRDDVGNWFEIGKEIETYSTEQEMVEKVRYYLEHEEKREEIRVAGVARLQRDHRISNRIDAIMEKVKEDKGNP